MRVTALIAFLAAFAEFLIATFVPLYLGMLFILALREVNHVGIRYLLAFALGALFWFSLDTMNDAVQLGVNEGYNFSFLHAALLFAFIAGFLPLALVSGISLSKKAAAMKEIYSNPAFVAMAAALGMGFHGIGEGLAFGGLSSGTQALTIIDAIGGYSGGVSYVLHKFLEATIVMVVYVAFANEGALFGRWRDVALLGLMFGIPSAVGEVLGYYFPVNATYFYAFGSGAALLVVLLVAHAFFRHEKPGQLKYGEWVGVVVAMIVGFVSLYAAALLHSG